MTIFGIGNDIIEIERIRSSLTQYGQRFLDRLFTPQEQLYCLGHQDPAIRFAGRFAAKEAVVKALGTGFTQGVTWLDIEILNDPKGKPEARLSTRLQKQMGAMHVLLSISHCREYASAVALIKSCPATS